MRILILNADYPRFLNWLYSRDPALKDASYARQMAIRNASLFGVADFYSRNFSALGHSAIEIHVNNRWIQSAWSREHGAAPEIREELGSGSRWTFPRWFETAVTPFKPVLRPLARRIGLSPRLDAQAEEILLSQIEEFRPDLVLNQDIFHVDASLARRIKSIGKPILVGQVGILPPRGEDWSTYDLLISQLSAVVRSFRNLGVRSEICHLAFEPTILDAFPAVPRLDVDVSFVGTVSADHQQRLKLLTAVAERYDLKFWGQLPNNLPASSPLRRSFQGEVWGADMYQVLRRSRVTLNSHIDMAGSEAGNMRLFEATGVGTFLLTDFKENLDRLFRADGEVGTWRSIDECLAKIGHLMDDDERRAAIARAGQARTLREHTYRHRAERILSLIDGIET